MNPAFVSFLCAVITTGVAVLAFKFGRMIGREQEYHRRSAPLLHAVKTIADATVAEDKSLRASHRTINIIATKAFKMHHPTAMQQEAARAAV